MSAADGRFFREAFLFVEICALPILAIPILYKIVMRERAGRAGGRLLLAIARPRVKFWKSVWLVCGWIAIFSQGAFCAFLTTRPRATLYPGLFQQGVNFLVLLMSVAASSAAWSGAFLELYERGVVWGANFAAWDTIREWTWYEKESTLRLWFRRGSIRFHLDESAGQAVRRVMGAQLANKKP